MQKIPRPTVFSANKSNTTSIKKEGSLETQTAAFVSELMNAATSFHKLHLKITGIGSHAAHKALNEIYDALPGHADDLAEGFQGASEKLLEYSDSAPRVLDNVSDAIAYLRDLTNMVNALQNNMPYSQIVNDLDNVKSSIDGVKYKLLFLK